MISPEDSKEILDDLAKRSETCRKLAKLVAPFPTEVARLTSAACAWGYAETIVKEWIERVNASAKDEIGTLRMQLSEAHRWFDDADNKQLAAQRQAEEARRLLRAAESRISHLENAALGQARGTALAPEIPALPYCQPAWAAVVDTLPPEAAEDVVHLGRLRIFRSFVARKVGRIAVPDSVVAALGLKLSGLSYTYDADLQFSERLTAFTDICWIRHLFPTRRVLSEVDQIAERIVGRHSP